MAKFHDYPVWPHGEDQSFEMMEIPQWALDAGFEDNAWHNDAAARMMMTRSPGVNLWVAEEKAEHREWPCEHRYILSVEIDGDPVPLSGAYFKSDDPEAVKAFLAAPSIDFTVARAASEIWEDLQDGTLPQDDITCFADVHCFVDGNEYGGAFEEWAWRDGGADNETHAAYWEEVQKRLDDWIRSGYQMHEHPVPRRSPVRKTITLGEADIELLIAACEDRAGQECYDKLAARLRAVSL